MIAAPARRVRAWRDGARIRCGDRTRAGIAAAGLTATVLLGALLRGALTPLSPPLATAAFVLVLAACTSLVWTSADSSTRWKLLPSLAAGVAAGLMLLLPSLHNGSSGRPLAEFWGWAAATAVVATLEEAAIRGVIQPLWSRAAGPVAGLLLGALAFALIHLPGYGAAAMPVDLAAGLLLGGLRLLTGRVAPCAIAHVVADWGAWFLA
jgi:membrane protease YdiL (CAAX protease family)